jgi:hypothetical protein
MIDNLFVNNALCRAIISLVNFCNEQRYYNQKELKFLQKMPLTKLEKDSVYKNKFIFNSAHKSGVDIN